MKKSEGDLVSGYINYYDSSHNYVSKLGYHVWFTEIIPLLIVNKTSLDGLKKYSIGGTAPILQLESAGAWVNLLSANKINAPVTPPLPLFLIDSDFYNQQTQYGQGLLLLSTLPFRSFKKAVLSTFGLTNKSARIIELPDYYLFYLGGLLWRESYLPTLDDPINWAGHTTLQTEKNYYLTNLGALNMNGSLTNTKTSTIKLEEALTKLPTKSKNLLIIKFKKWVDSLAGFSNFERLCSDYRGPLIDPLQGGAAAGNGIVSELNKTTKMILPSPMILFPNDTSPENLKNGLLINEDVFIKYFNSFKQQFVFTDEDNDTGEESSSENETDKGNKTEIATKFRMYNYFKNINNKWACSENIVNTCGPGGPLIDSFKFINRGWGRHR